MNEKDKQIKEYLENRQKILAERKKAEQTRKNEEFQPKKNKRLYLR